MERDGRRSVLIVGGGIGGPTATPARTTSKVHDPRSNTAVCVADREAIDQATHYPATEAGLTVAELAEEGARGGDIHVGIMHRFEGLEYQRLAIVGARGGVIPRASVVQHYRDTDPRRLAREERPGTVRVRAVPRRRTAGPGAIR
ncbi:hypothetical protein ACWG5P_05320 [Streptomyces prasinus]